MAKISIQCVVVLYKCTLDDSKTLQSLAAFSSDQSDLAQRMALLIYDNSPEPQPHDLDAWALGAVEYRHSKKNGGLAEAYNHALAICRQDGVEWLLLLDQDTKLDASLFPVLFAAVTSPLPAEICAVVPRLSQGGRILSPEVVSRFAKHELPHDFSGIYPKPVTAFNSAACMRVKAVAALGGFPKEYWLDYLDHIMFHRLQAAGGKVLILDVTIIHQLSLQNMEAEMSLGRHENVLAAEWSYVRESGFGGGPLFHRLRLLKRALSYSIKIRNQSYATQVLRAAVK